MPATPTATATLDYKITGGEDFIHLRNHQNQIVLWLDRNGTLWLCPDGDPAHASSYGINADLT